MKKILVAAALILFGFSTVVLAADNDTKQMPRRMQGMKAYMASLNLTDAQKKELSQLKVDTEKRGIELRAKAATAKLDLKQLLMSESPDQTAIQKKMSEVAKEESDVRMNRIDGWFAANKMLTPDQQKVWLKALRFGTERAMRRHAMNMNRNRQMHRPDRTAAPHPEMQ
jgi:Spy/CpxP family protein refolding chaperone